MNNGILYGGHSTVLISIKNTVILTDPNLSKRIWIIRRRNKPGIDQSQLDMVNLVLVSHGHYDHLDIPTIKRLPRTATVIVPHGLDHYFKRYGFKDVRCLSWWEQTTAQGLKIVAVPANHFKGRHPFLKSLYQGYVIDSLYQIYFAGDTGMFDEIKEIGKLFKLSVALLPIGAYKPWSKFGHHMTPEDSIKAFKYLNAGVMIPIHWGAFKLAMEPMDEPVNRLLSAAKDAGIGERVVVLQPGEMYKLD